MNSCTLCIIWTYDNVYDVHISSALLSRILKMEESNPKDFIYDPKLLQEIDFDKEHKIQYNPPISLSKPAPNLVVRPFSRQDINKAQCDVMFSSPKSYFITVIEDTSTGQIVGNATLHVEYKFYKKCGLRGRIEDIAVHEKYRGKQLGKLLVEVSTLLARRVGCFRVSLHCFAKFIPFYSEQGFYIDELENLMWLKDSYLEKN
ncbi:hypothetical protein FSP39_021975 [Pinctada imbricata]|uniref:Glucosamine 6-phosphate N-acetyltransferase n=1 Tax=Pinctada imbricata TaxID=66713 RepID=A0AA88Y4D0_PINIB|nr:hypothetical protein FSP39_021975 [Pinctada imbricata]